MASYTSVVKLSEALLKVPVLKSILVPASQKFCDLAGYRKLGLKFDDIIHEENEVYQKALTRLSKDELYARNFRTLTAAQCGITHHLLPKDKWVKPEEDKSYIFDHLVEIETELFEKAELDNIKPIKA